MNQISPSTPLSGPRTGGTLIRLCIVAPCLNESAGAHRFLEELQAVLTSMPDVECHVVVVDDGSTDETLAVLTDDAARMPWLRVVSLARNFGHQTAISCGLDHAGDPDAVVMMDSDLQHPPILIPEMVRLWRGGVDIVQCVRRDTEGASVAKRGASGLFYRVFNALSDTQIAPGAADFCLLSSRALGFLRGMPERHRFLRGMLAWTGLPRASVPYVAPPRRTGSSSFSPRRMVALALDAIVSFSSRPLRLSSHVGLALVAAGMLYLVYVIGIRVWYGGAVPGWASVIGVVLILGGGQLLMLGIVGEYVARLFEETKGRPLYIVKFDTGESGRPVPGSRE